MAREMYNSDKYTFHEKWTDRLTACEKLEEQYPIYFSALIYNILQKSFKKPFRLDTAELYAIDLDIMGEGNEKLKWWNNRKLVNAIDIIRCVGREKSIASRDFPPGKTKIDTQKYKLDYVQFKFCMTPVSLIVKAMECSATKIGPALKKLPLYEGIDSEEKLRKYLNLHNVNNICSAIDSREQEIMRRLADLKRKISNKLTWNDYPPLTSQQVESLFNVHRSTLYRWNKDGITSNGIEWKPVKKQRGAHGKILYPIKTVLAELQFRHQKIIARNRLREQALQMSFKNRK